MNSCARAARAAAMISVRVALGFREHPGVDRSDWCWYAVLPPIGYALLVAAAAAASRAMPASLDLLAAALIGFLIAGIRNAWDMTLWIVIRTPTPPRS